MDDKRIVKGDGGKGEKVDSEKKKKNWPARGGPGRLGIFRTEWVIGGGQKEITYDRNLRTKKGEIGNSKTTN